MVDMCDKRAWHSRSPHVRAPSSTSNFANHINLQYSTGCVLHIMCYGALALVASFEPGRLAAPRPSDALTPPSKGPLSAKRRFVALAGLTDRFNGVGLAAQYCISRKRLREMYCSDVMGQQAFWH